MFTGTDFRENRTFTGQFNAQELIRLRGVQGFLKKSFLSGHFFCMSAIPDDIDGERQYFIQLVIRS